MGKGKFAGETGVQVMVRMAYLGLPYVVVVVAVRLSELLHQVFGSVK